MEKKNKRKEKSNPIAEFFWKNKRRRAKNFHFLLMTVVVAVSVLMAFINEKLELMDTGEEVKTEVVEQQQQPAQEYIYDEEDIKNMTALSWASSVNDYLYQWANNGGDLYSSKNVINVLLIGLDSNTALKEGGRSDSIILVSLNKKTKKINMTSFFRDTWIYMNTKGGDLYNKLNASYFYGGPELLIDTIQKNYKVKIDHYVAVDFSSFVDIIDKLGGITVEVQEYEAKYLNSTTKFHIKSGPKVKLRGIEALGFARIRKSDADSDVSRTRRQRQVITSFINSAKSASLSQLNGALDMLFKYVKTDLTKMEILSYGTQALAYGWINYEIDQTVISDPEMFTTGMYNGVSAVFSDFPLAARRVQKAIYGDTNIKLPENRIKLFSLIR